MVNFPLFIEKPKVYAAGAFLLVVCTINLYLVTQIVTECSRNATAQAQASAAIQAMRHPAKSEDTNKVISEWKRKARISEARLKELAAQYQVAESALRAALESVEESGKVTQIQTHAEQVPVMPQTPQEAIARASRWAAGPAIARYAGEYRLGAAATYNLGARVQLTGSLGMGCASAGVLWRF